MASSLREPKPGDLIEIFRFGYEHWAIYVGDGYVIHLAPPILGDFLGAGSSSLFSVLSSTAVVKQERLKDVVGNCDYQINNYLDHRYRPRPVEEIISSAKEKVGKKMEYSVLTKNCEHFVTDLRYGTSWSKQVEEVLSGGGTTTTLGILTTILHFVFNRRSQSQ
ncbi:retinoic acid receptor responder protein 3-like [Tupaia chinensis]|uniref:retinoic acid receptor responder protein 3-like n=1 Tax=Tupaia chinensis TaxID=246437 RepID=UPI0003C8CDD8|nr:retinoic acid receptor responder protein 3-like [Tupaia chinensis]